MKRPTRLFSKLIVCKYCGKFHRFQQNRVKKIYICSTYSRSGECVLNRIDEDILKKLIANHFKLHNRELEMNNNFLREEIGKILISENEILIECKNLPNIINNENRLSFID